MQEAKVQGAARELSDDVVLGMLTSLVRMLSFEDAARVFRKQAESFDRSIAVADLPTVAGAVAALRREDGVFPSDVDGAAALARGASMFEVAARRVPWKSLRITPSGWHNGAHLVHAAGFAWAAKMRRDDAVALALGPEDVLETGEVHNALNFAGVFKLPAIFVVRVRESAVTDLRARALEYGITVVTTDGTDPVAVCKTVREARARAVSGGGSTLVGGVVPRRDRVIVDALEPLRKHVVALKAATTDQIEQIVDEALRESTSAFAAES